MDLLASLQMAGAVLILAAFALGQLDRLAPDCRLYHRRLHLGANAIGSAVLAGTAAAASEWGFVLLGTCWALASLYGLARRSRLAGH